MERNGPVIDMTPDGRFVAPPRAERVASPRAQPSFIAIMARLAAFGVVVCVAAIAFWAALFIIPLLILLGAAGYAALRLFGPRRATLHRF